LDALEANSTTSSDKKAGLNELEDVQTIPENARQGMNIQTGVEVTPMVGESRLR
jgi:hypothetical protein